MAVKSSLLSSVTSLFRRSSPNNSEVGAIICGAGGGESSPPVTGSGFMDTSPNLFFLFFFPPSRRGFASNFCCCQLVQPAGAKEVGVDLEPCWEGWQQLSGNLGLDPNSRICNAGLCLSLGSGLCFGAGPFHPPLVFWDEI